MGGCMDSFVGFASSGVWALAGQWVLVEWTPCLWLHMCPVWVSSDSGKNLLAFFTCTRGHDRLLLLRMALSQVTLVGNLAAPWRYRIDELMLGNLYTLLISSEGDGLSFFESLYVFEHASPGGDFI